MTRARTTLTLLAGIVLGAIMSVPALEYQRARSTTSRWYPLQTEGRGLGYITEALFGVDIPLPKVGSIRGEAKFVPTNDRRFVQLGYRVKVPVATLDASKIPPKYTQGAKRTDGWETLPTEQVVYETSFAFRLKDADGFVIQEMASTPHDLTSGKENVFQSLVATRIPAESARRVAAVQISMTVQKCVTCQPGR